MPCSSGIISEMRHEIYTMENCDFLKSMSVLNILILCCYGKPFVVFISFPFSAGTNSHEKEFAHQMEIPFFPLREEPFHFWKGFVVQGSNQEVASIVSF